MKKDNLTRRSLDLHHLPPLTDGELARRKAIADLPEEAIDFSDIPRSGEHFFNDAVRGKFFRRIKKQLTLRLDADLIEWFKRHPESEGGARGYQTRINRALREYVIAREDPAKKAG